MNCKISVVIPARNRAHALAACLDSVLAQTFPANEILVVNDHSTDSTVDMLAPYRDRGVQCIDVAISRGAQAARATGVVRARNNWIAFQDSDDIWLPDKLERQVAELAKVDFSPNLVIHGDGILRNVASGFEEPLLVPLTQGDCYRELLLRPAPSFPTMLAPKEAILLSGALDLDCPSYQEWDTSIRLSRYCRFAHIQEPLFVWIRHAGDAISDDFSRDVLGWNRVLDRHKDAIIQEHGQAQWRRSKVLNLIRALQADLWVPAGIIVSCLDDSACACCARLLVGTRSFPRGSARLLLWLADR